MILRKIAVALATSSAVALGTLGATTSVAHADATLPTVTEDAGANSSFAGGSGATILSVSYSYPQAMPVGATEQVSVQLCGGTYVTSPAVPLAGAHQTFDSSSDEWKVGSVDSTHMAFSYSRFGGGIANPFHYTVTVSAPGYASETVIGGFTASGYDTCSSTGGGSAPATPLVTAWSYKVKSNPKVGHYVSVSATHAAAGASVRYYWKVGTRTVKSGSGRALRIRSAYRGKTIKVVVKVVKGSRSASHGIGFGKAHR